MADLSTAEGRIASARRPTTNRDGILPARRQTDLPNFTVTADMRSAARGDGGARELQKALGLFQDAAGDFGRAREANRADEYAAQRADGALDAATGGAADPAMAKSSAYQEAFYGAKAEGEFRTFEADLKRQLQEKIDGGEDPDAVKEFFQSQVAGFVERTRDGIPVASAQLATAKSLQALAGELEVGVSKALKDRMDTDFITTVQNNISLDAKAGRPMETERYINTIMLTGKSPADAKKAVLEAYAAVALDPNDPDPEIIQALIDSKRADGKTPSLSPDETVRAYELLGAARNLESQRENRETAAATDEMYTTLYARLDTGEDVDVTEFVRPYRESGKVDPSSAASLEQTFRGFINSREEGDLDEDVQLNTALAASKPGLSIAARRKIWEDALPNLGNGTAAKRVFIGAMVQLNGEEEARRTAARSGGSGGGGIGPSGRRPIDAAEDLFDAVLKPPSGTRWPDPGSVYGLYSSARAYMYGEIGKGTSPLEAAQAAIAKYSYLAKRVEKARGEGGGAGGLGFVPGAAPGGVVAVPASELAKYQ